MKSSNENTKKDERELINYRPQQLKLGGQRLQSMHSMNASMVPMSDYHTSPIRILKFLNFTNLKINF